MRTAAQLLPVAVLVLADVRAEAPLDRSRLAHPRVFLRGAAPRRLLCVGALAPAGESLHVRFLDADEPDAAAT